MLQSLLKKITNQKTVEDSNSKFYTSSIHEIKQRKRSDSLPMIIPEENQVSILLTSKSCPQEINCPSVVNVNMETKNENRVNVAHEEVFKLEIDQKSTNGEEILSDDIKTLPQSKRFVLIVFKC